ncbi:hypothetical protein REH65_25390 [Saccharopolyspora sp. ID03-671]|uniref:hypothetical protein n=1 Tax=Saccharopolyspora sp. ID03-671 TaxID=3073066 RepID=UPI00324BB8F1
MTVVDQSSSGHGLLPHHVRQETGAEGELSASLDEAADRAPDLDDSLEIIQEAARRCRSNEFQCFSETVMSVQMT